MESPTEYGYIPINIGNRICMQQNGTEMILPPNGKDLPPPPLPPASTEIFIKNIPKNLRLLDLMPYFARFGAIYDARLMFTFNGQNRGFGFIRYYNEADAAKAMCITNNNCIIQKKRLIVEASQDKKSLYLGNIPPHLSLATVKESLCRIIRPTFKELVIYPDYNDETRHQGFAFLEFNSHEEAVEVKRQYYTGLLPLNCNDTCVITWKKERYPPRRKKGQVKDHYECLRLTCMANFLQVPTIIFGTVCEDVGIQYCAIVLRSNVIIHTRAIFIEITIVPGIDILSRICEIAENLIYFDGGFIHNNYIIKANDSYAYVVGVLQEKNNHIMKFIHPRPDCAEITHWNEICHLCNAVKMISLHTTAELLQLYEASLRYNSFISNSIYDRILYPITSAYRSRPPMPCGITNIEMIFLLCYANTAGNVFYKWIDRQWTKYLIKYDVHYNGRLCFYNTSSMTGCELVARH